MIRKSGGDFYLIFKKTFKEVVGTTVGKHAAFQYLVGALPQAVKMQVSCYSQDPDDLWEQLDAIYEQPGAQVDAAIEDLRLVVVDKT